MVNSTMWTPSERTWENCSVSEFFNFFFSSLCALWQLSFELSARTHSPYIASARPRSAHGERLGTAQVTRGVVGQACKVSSPQIADLWIILCYDELFGTWVVDDAKRPKKRSMRSPGGNKHRLVAGNRPAGVGQAVGRWKDASSRWSAGVDNAAPSRPTWGVEGRETTKQH